MIAAIKLAAIAAFCIARSSCAAFSSERGLNAISKNALVDKDPGISCQDSETECNGGCCNFPNGVCCGDDVKCCPSDTVCNSQKGTCDPKIAWKAVGNVVCPGGGSECPDGSTCCRLSTGEYGCCPLPNAVCCTDGEHCCPQGYTCNTGAGTCVKGNSEIPWLEKSLAKAVGNVVCPGGGSECPDGSTCCRLSTGEYGCCPLPNAVCCTDGEHCCPQGYTCNTGAGTCVKGNSEIPWLEKSLAKAVGNVVCPGGGSECPDGSTCCRLSTGEYGCCPLPNAVCCTDGEHCCPQGYTCNTGAGTCVKGNSEIPWLEKSLAKAVGNVVCPGGGSECPDGSTCCRLSTGEYGCCPLPNAVCCTDGEHCCPQGYTCNTGAGTCVKGNSEIPWLEKSLAKAVGNVVCPGGGSECPDGSTCCRLSTGEYGCCPLPNAVCCTDGEHCCPQGYTCNTGAGTCVKGNSEIPWLEKSLAKAVGNVVCPGGGSECPDGSTCCRLSTGEYGCCPLPNAVCCTDGEHCCPQGYTCNTGAGTCVKGNSEIPWLEKSLAKAVGNVVCPGGGSECPDGSTCCRLSTGEYGCCPLPNAVCCTDGEHCCPQGYTCNTGAGTCVKGNSEIPWLEKSLAKAVGNVVCPGGGSECPDGSTCCRLSTGEYGCCPLPNAVCCTDGEHCCPQGYTCNTGAGTCVKGNSEIPWLEKSLAKAVGNVVCPGGGSECPDGSTCCRLSTGEYGCCPLPNAVCCTDGEHCCPQGYTCNTGAGTCFKGNSEIPWLEKSLAKAVGNVVCPGGGSECPDGSTCCRLSTGEYGCCPLPNAVCCTDGEHCCPQGYTCNTGAGTCVKGNSEIPWLEKSLAKAVGNVVCPGGGSECPDGSTCCRLSTGEYGCCPLPNAVCCTDGEHCCPQGYTCNTGAGTCVKGNSEIPWLEKSLAKAVGNVVCPGGGSECPDGSTCCRLSTGEYGCCPLPNAVCCTDGEHCCPQGYTCNTGAGTCFKGNSEIPWLEKSLAKAVRPKGNKETSIENTISIDHCVMCPDDSECPNFSTCCQLESGGYGCCSYPQAVCCSDHLHCCRHGQVCDVQQGICINSDGSQHLMLQMKFFEKRSFSVAFEEISLDEM